MPIEKKYIKLSIAGLAVVALVIGLSVGLTQKNRSSANNAASNAQSGTNVASDAADVDQCYGKSGKSGGAYGKSGKSGERNRKLIVPGTEEFVSAVGSGKRRKLRNELMRDLGSDDGMGTADTTDGMDGGDDGNTNGGGGGGGGGTNGGGDGGMNSGGDGNVGGKNGGKGNNNAAGGSANTEDYDYSKSGKSGGDANNEDYDYDYYYEDYDYSKSGKSGNKSGKSGDGTCDFVYDPCDPDTWPNAKSGKSGGAYGKTGKSGDATFDTNSNGAYGKSGKSGNKSGKSGSPGSYGSCPCPGGKSGKSGGAYGKTGKSGGGADGASTDGDGAYGKSGKSGNKSGKSGFWGDDCDCMPTLCPVTPPCVCENLPFAFMDGKCVRGCGKSEAGEYDTRTLCCDDNFNSDCIVEDCNAAPTYSPTVPPPTYAPTVFVPANTPPPTSCDCTAEPWVFNSGECVRGCDVSGNDDFNTRRECCEANFPNFLAPNDDCLTNDLCCDCEMLPVAYDPSTGRCVKGCGLSEGGDFTSIQDCCVANFGTGDCSTNDECPVFREPTPAPTSGSTPTVSTEATGPPTGARRSEDV